MEIDVPASAMEPTAANKTPPANGSTSRLNGMELASPSSTIAPKTELPSGLPLWPAWVSASATASMGNSVACLVTVTAPDGSGGEYTHLVFVDASAQLAVAGDISVGGLD